MNENARICPLCGWEDKLWRPPRPKAKTPGKVPAGRTPFDDTYAEFYQCPQCRQRFVLDEKPIDPNSIKCPNPNCGALFSGAQSRIKPEDFNTPVTKEEIEPLPSYESQAAPSIRIETIKPREKPVAVPDYPDRPAVGVETSNQREHFRKPLKDSGGEIPDLSKITRPLLYLFAALAICAALFFGIRAIIDAVGNIDFSSTGTPQAGPVTNVEIQSILENSVNEADAVIAWQTNIPASSQVEYGTTEALGMSSALDMEMVTDHTVRLDNLEPGTTYFYKVISTDAGGVTAVSSSDQFTTVLPPDNVPPVILDLKITQVSDIGAVISWKTDEKASSLIRFGTTTSYSQKIDVNTNLSLEHSIVLKDLYPSTTYHFSLRCKDAQGNEVTSSDSFFQTKELVKVGYEEGNRAPDFTLVGIDGKTFSLSEMRGQTVVLNFWRIACPACVYELPFFQEVYEELNRSQQADKPLIYTVDLMDYEEHVHNLVEQNNYTFPILLDFDGTTMRQYGLKSIPMTFFIDGNGIITRVQLGRFDSADEFKEILESY